MGAVTTLVNVDFTNECFMKNIVFSTQLDLCSLPWAADIFRFSIHGHIWIHRDGPKKRRCKFGPPGRKFEPQDYVCAICGIEYDSNSGDLILYDVKYETSYANMEFEIKILEIM